MCVDTRAAKKKMRVTAPTQGPFCGAPNWRQVRSNVPARFDCRQLSNKTYPLCDTARNICVKSHIVSAMELAADGENFGDMAKCRWCDASIGLAHHILELVCVKCFRRLQSENVPDVEIFGREIQE